MPISITKKNFGSDGYSPVRPNVHERVLYTRPVNAADMVHAPSEPKAGNIFGSALLAALSGAAMGVSVVAAAPVYGVLLGSAGALASFAHCYRAQLRAKMSTSAFSRSRSKLCAHRCSTIQWPQPKAIKRHTTKLSA